MPAERLSQSSVSQKVIEGLRPVVESIGHTRSGYYPSEKGYQMARQGYVSGLLPHITAAYDERVYVGSFFQMFPFDQRPPVMTADSAAMLKLRYGFLPTSYGQEAIDGLKAIASGENLGNPYILRFRTPMQEIAEILHITFGDEMTRNVLSDALTTRTAGNIGTDADRETLKGIVAKMTGGTANTHLLEQVVAGLKRL